MVEGAATGQCLGLPLHRTPFDKPRCSMVQAHRKGSGPPKPLTCSKRAPDRSLASMPDTLPVIDLSDTPALAGNVGAAARDVGFFYLTGHGVPPALIEEVFKASAAFFALRDATKERLSITPLAAQSRLRRHEGREPRSDQAGGPQGGLQHRPRPSPRRSARVVAGQPFRGVNVWPELAGWRETMLAYFNAVWDVGRRLHRGIALDLGLARGLSSRTSSIADGDAAPPPLSAAAAPRRSPARSAPASTPTMAT